MLRELPISVAGSDLGQTLGAVLDLAHIHGLTSYDASYVALAMREGVPGRLPKRVPVAAGLTHDPAHFAGHNLRAGLATSAAGGVPERAIMNQSGHRLTMVHC